MQFALQMAVLVLHVITLQGDLKPALLVSGELIVQIHVHQNAQLVIKHQEPVLPALQDFSDHPSVLHVLTVLPELYAIQQQELAHHVLQASGDLNVMLVALYSVILAIKQQELVHPVQLASLDHLLVIPALQIVLQEQLVIQLLEIVLHVPQASGDLNVQMLAQLVAEEIAFKLQGLVHQLALQASGGQIALIVAL